MRWLFPLAVLCLILGCAGGTSKQRTVSYSSGVAPKTFDLEARMRSPGSYEANGVLYSFAELSALVSRRNAKSVLVRDTKSVGDIICLPMLGIDSNSSVFFANDNGAPRAVVWSGDAEKTANILEGCRH